MIATMEKGKKQRGETQHVPKWKNNKSFRTGTILLLDDLKEIFILPMPQSSFAQSFFI